VLADYSSRENHGCLRVPSRTCDPRTSAGGTTLPQKACRKTQTEGRTLADTPRTSRDKASFRRILEFGSFAHS
jgi:hypothetical protein